MYLLKVLTQQSVYALDRDFYYLSEELVKVGSRVLITFNNKEMIGFVLECEKTNQTKEELEDEYGFNLIFISEILDQDPIMSDELFKLANLLKERYFYPLIGVLQTMLPPTLRPKKLATKTPKIAYNKFYELVKESTDEELNSREQKLFDEYKICKKKPVSEQNTSKSLLKLLNLGLVKEVIEEKYRYEINPLFNYHSSFELSEEQNKVFKEILTSNDETYLLQGVTGSGKTEVYIKLIEDAYKNGKDAIVLVPEIALTPLMISRLYSYFGNEIAVLHSSLTPSQKYDEYRLIANGEARIVVGTRSAIFAPVKNLGIIVIDEENDGCYKEDVQGLLYNAIDVAKIRAKMNGCKVILGSATPSIESAARAKAKKYHFVELKERYSKVELPQVQIVDLNDSKMYTKVSSIFTLPMIKGLKDTILNGEKAILMINTRGYSKRYYCRECGKVYKCPKCDLPLFYHKDDKKLCCHHCDYKMSMPNRCDKCGGRFFGYGNFGIEKVEEDFKKLFPGIKYGVLDSDHTPKTKQIEEVLAKFEAGEIQVLIGTQLVSRGHDFEGVNFVGLLDADSTLNFPNYRNREMTYSLITQTIGRAGRNDKQGLAIIQTREPDNPVIKLAAEQDFDRFLSFEYAKRELYKYPPIVGMLSIVISGKSENEVVAFGERIRDYVISENIKNVSIFGPTKSYFTKGRYETNVVIKYKKLVEVKDMIIALINFYKLQQRVRIVINFNPYTY